MPRKSDSSKASALTIAATLLAAVLSLWGAIQFWDGESSYQRRSPDPFRIAEQENRFAEARAALPAGATLGYFTDLNPGDTLASAMFFAAQYHLAPRLLLKSTGRDLVLGNFQHPGDFAARGGALGLRVDRDFGNGVVLYRREAHP